MVVGEEEIFICVIGCNELLVIVVMYVYVDVQQDYYYLNYCWVQKIISSEGKKDGLYWLILLGEVLSLFGLVFSLMVFGSGYYGYCF